MELNIKNIFKKYENSSRKWILPIPVIENGQLKLRCYMNHNGRECDSFDAVYTYKVNLLIMHNFLMEISNGQAYWKYIRCKEPRTNFLEETDRRTKTYIDRKEIYQVIKDGRTEYILDIIDKKFNQIQYVFSIISLDEVIEKEKQEKELLDMGYDY